MKTVAFFNNKGGVGKTTLVYHVSQMLSELGVETLAVDLDPQANLTSMFLDENELETLFDQESAPPTIFGAIQPIIKGTGDVSVPITQEINPRLRLIAGDLNLSRYEDKLSEAWPRCHNEDEAAFRVMTAFHRAIRSAGDPEITLLDVGPNLGAINRSALIAADFVILTLAPDLFSLQGLRNLGPTLNGWRKTWKELLRKAPAGLSIPTGDMNPLGYVVMQHGSRQNRPVKAYSKWLERIPSVYREELFPEAPERQATEPGQDCLANLKHYRSLMSLAMEARKPMFALKPADGAIGAHQEAVRRCWSDFEALARKIMDLAIGTTELD
jgi:chromosome partitioning protein